MPLKFLSSPLVFFFLVLNFHAVNAADKLVSYQIKHFDNVELSIDGKLDEAAWAQAETVELKFESEPSENIPAKEKTTAYYFENGEYLYIGFDARDSDASLIRAVFNDRDQSWNDDQVSIMIDTFNDERRAYQFFVNPLGVQSDSFIDEVNSKEDVSWDAIWESAGFIHENGYSIEMAIPLRAIRFNDGLAQQTWGIEFIRFLPRDNRHRFSSMKRIRGHACNLCQLEKVTGLNNIKASKHFEVIPTVTLVKNEEREDILSSDWRSEGVESEMGADIRWGINQDVYLNATINPDFSQVESDSAQLNVNTNFALFFPEKRTFFLDGADYFETDNQLVHTRNIGDPDYGLKLTGKFESNAYGVIVANDTGTNFLLPSANGSDLAILENENGRNQESDVLIARWRKDVGDRNSVGALLTYRNGDNYSNRVISSDARFWLSNKDSMNIQFSNSKSENPEQLRQEFSLEKIQTDNAYSIKYQHNDRDWHWFANHRKFGRDFRADLGFVGQVDFTKSGFGGRRNWYFENNDWLTHINIYSDYDVTHNESGQMLEEELEAWLNIEGPKQFSAWFGLGRRYRYERKLCDQSEEDILSIEYCTMGDNTVIKDGGFYETFIGTGVFIRPIPEVRYGIRGRFGDKVDLANIQMGTIHEFSPELEWQINENIKTSFRHVLSWLDVSEGELYKARLSDFRLAYQFDLRSRLKVSIQHLNIQQNQDLYLFDDSVNKTNKNLATQIIYSYKINPRTLIFAGYADSGYQDDSVSSIVKNHRSFFTKFSYSWQM